MSDLFGLLELPAPPVADGQAVTDPALDLLLDFCKDILNADLGEAWASVCAAEPLPVGYVFNHDPDLEDFNTNDLPALYMWRADDTGSGRWTQDLVSDEGGFHALWVPPPATFENRAARAAFSNGIKKSLKSAIAQGRHPAWVVDGDTYYQPEDYGSVLLKHTGFTKARFGQMRAHKLIIETEDKSGKTPFDCLFFTVETMETFSQDADGADGYTDLDHLEGTVTLPDRNADGTIDDGT